MPLISLSCCFSVRWDVLLLRSRSFYDDHLVSSQAGITPGSQNKHKVKSPPPCVCADGALVDGASATQAWQSYISQQKNPRLRSPVDSSGRSPFSALGQTAKALLAKWVFDGFNKHFHYDKKGKRAWEGLAGRTHRTGSHKNSSLLKWGCFIVPQFLLQITITNSLSFSVPK